MREDACTIFPRCIMSVQETQMDEEKQSLGEQLLERNKPPSPSTKFTLQYRFRNIYDHRLESANLPDEDERYKARKLLALEMLEAGRWLLQEAKTEFKEELRIRDKSVSIPKWRQAPTIRKALDKTKFEQVWAYIWNNTKSYPETERIYGLEPDLSFHQRKGPNNQQYLDYCILFQPDYEDMEEKLKLKEPTLMKYLQRMTEAGVIFLVKKHGGKDNKKTGIYAVGYFVKYLSKELNPSINTVPFLTDSKQMRKRLREFKL